MDLVGRQFCVISRESLHEKLVDFLRHYYGGLRMSAAGPRAAGLSSAEYRRGVSAGQPDLMLHQLARDGPATALAFYFLDPAGGCEPGLRERRYADDLRAQRVAVVFTDSYDEALLAALLHLGPPTCPRGLEPAPPQEPNSPFADASFV